MLNVSDLNTLFESNIILLIFSGRQGIFYRHWDWISCISAALCISGCRGLFGNSDGAGNGQHNGPLLRNPGFDFGSTQVYAGVVVLLEMEWPSFVISELSAKF